MSKKQPLKKALKAYYVDKTLSVKQFDALHRALNSQKNTPPPVKKIKWLGLLVASLALFVMLIGYYIQPPGVITAAYVDIEKDATHYNDLAESMRQWMDKNQIAAVPQQYPLEMSKFCRLDQMSTTHLRIAGARQGVVHLFFHSGPPPFQWRNRAGVMDNMNWKLLKVRDQLTLIVLYSHDMREKAVRHILQKMLPQLEIS